MTELERQVLYNEIMDRASAKIEKETDEKVVGKLNEILYTALCIVACMPTVEQPQINATENMVEIVRCKDCIYQTECAFTEWLGRNGNGFCSCGERKEDGNAHNTDSTR